MRLATTLLLAFFVFLSTTTQAQTIPTAHVVTRSIDTHSFDTVETFEVPESIEIQKLNLDQGQLNIISQEDIYYLSRTMWGEARGEGSIGMLHVGSVIINRLRDPRYPKTIRDVVLQPSQFSVWHRHKTRGYKLVCSLAENDVYSAEKLAIQLLTQGPINNYISFESRYSGHGGRVIGNHRFKV